MKVSGTVILICLLSFGLFGSALADPGLGEINRFQVIHTERNLNNDSNEIESVNGDNQHDSVVQDPVNQLQTTYENAMKAIESGNYDEAAQLLNTIPDHPDYERQMRVIEQRLIPYDIVCFGSYEQDNNTMNGPEPIEWYVLERDGNRALLLSKYGLDCKSYHSHLLKVNWIDSTLRQWLNNSFLKSAFTEDEANAIVSERVDNTKKQHNPKLDTNVSVFTRDKVFLLSYAEAIQCFALNAARTCELTAFAISQGGYISNEIDVYGKVTGMWWLRSPGSFTARHGEASYVNSSGNPNGVIAVNQKNVAVRPALWVDMDKVVLQSIE